MSLSEIQQLYSQGAGNKMALSPAGVSPSGAVTAATSTATGLNQGLIGYWTMDARDINWGTRKIVDRSGNGNTGTLYGLGVATSTVLGKVGQGIRSDGLGYIDIPAPSAELRSGKKTFAISLWANPDNFSHQENGLYSCGGAVDSVYLDDIGRVMIDQYPPAGGQFYGPFVSRGRWSHIVVMYSSSTRKVYLNGVMRATDNSAEVFSGTAPASCRIGSQNYLDNRYRYEGRLDDIRVYNRALSDQEVKQLYQQGTGNKMALSPAGVSPSGAVTAATSTATGLNSGLVGYWTMDARDINWGTRKIVDRSGNGNTGNLVGLAAATGTAPGKLGQAIALNGTTTYVSIPSSPSISFTSPNITVSGWVKMNARQNAELAIVRKDTQYALEIENNMSTFKNLVSTNVTTGWTETTKVAYPFNPGVWYFTSFTYDGSVLRQYVNGAQIGVDKYISGAINMNNNALMIGRNAPFDMVLNGLVDDVRIYNRALSAQEIQQLYSMGR